LFFFLSEPEAGFFKDFKVLFHGAVGPFGLSPSCMLYMLYEQEAGP
jgi:hypothetical protein